MSEFSVDHFNFGKAAVVRECFVNECKYRKKYGQNTMVLTQIGSFYENYGLSHPQTKEILPITNLVEFMKICDLNKAEKNSTVENVNEGKL